MFNFFKTEVAHVDRIAHIQTPYGVYKAEVTNESREDFIARIRLQGIEAKSPLGTYEWLAPMVIHTVSFQWQTYFLSCVLPWPYTWFM